MQGRRVETLRVGACDTYIHCVRDATNTCCGQLYKQASIADQMNKHTVHTYALQICMIKCLLIEDFSRFAALAFVDAWVTSLGSTLPSALPLSTDMHMYTPSQSAISLLS